MREYFTETWHDMPYELPDDDDNLQPVTITWCELKEQYVYRDGSYDEHYYISCIGLLPGEGVKISPRWKSLLWNIIVDEHYNGKYYNVTYS